MPICTFRFHHTAVQLLPTSGNHGPHSLIVGPPARVLRPLAWLVSIALALGYGFAMSDEWQTFALYLKQPATSAFDPVFHRTVGFYLFTLPVYDLLSSWLSTIAFIALIAAAVYALATLSNGTQATGETTRRLRYMGLSCALAAYLLTLAWDVFLDRYPYLWGEHQTFSGVTYTEDHFVLPGLMIVAITLLVGALIALLNAFTRRGRLLRIRRRYWFFLRRRLRFGERGGEQRGDQCRGDRLRKLSARGLFGIGRTVF